MPIIFLNSEDGNFLFIVDSITLFEQAVKDIKEFFEKYGGVEIGEIKSGSIDLTKRVTVAMVQTLQSIFSKNYRDKKIKTLVGKYFRQLKFLCVDEIHDNCSNARLSIYKKAKSLEYQLCLSATPYRQGAFVQNLKLQAWSGDIIYTITEQTLCERGVLSDYLVFMMLMDHNIVDYDVDNEDSLVGMQIRKFQITNCDIITVGAHNFQISYLDTMKLQLTQLL